MTQDTVAVVGSGASGLAAAFRLREAGYRVRLLERAGKPGGRMSTVHRDGFSIEEGPSGLTRGHRSILGIVRDAGLADEVVEASSLVGIADRGDDIHLMDAHRIARDALKTSLVSTRTKLALGRLVLDLLRYRRRIDVEDLSKLAALDGESAAQFARRRYGDEAFEKVIDPCVRPLVIGHSEELSAADLMQVFSAFMANQDFVAFRDGMGSYPALLAPLFDTVLNAEVLEVSERPDSVVVRWCDERGAEQSESVAGVVLACDAQTTARVHSGLDADRRDFLREGVRFQPLVHVNVATSVPHTEACYVFPVATHHPRLVGLTFEHNKVPGRAPAGKGMVGIYPTPRWSDELFDQDDDIVAKHLVDEAEEILPGLSSSVEFTHLARVTPAVMNSYPGYWTKMAEFRRRSALQDRRIRLAGDYFCVSSVNAASAAGERAARELAAVLKTR